MTYAQGPRTLPEVRVRSRTAYVRQTCARESFLSARRQSLAPPLPLPSQQSKGKGRKAVPRNASPSPLPLPRAPSEACPGSL